MDANERQRSLSAIRESYALALAYFTTDAPLRHGRHSFQGIALPEGEARRFFSTNAQSWLGVECSS
jgi:hypothetical protein